MNKKNVKKGMLPYVILLGVIVIVAYILAFGNTKVNLLIQFLLRISNKN